MKKILIIAASLLLAASVANAQNGLLNALKSAVSGSSVSDVVSNVVSGVTSSAQTVNLAGKWTYNGVGAAVKSDNILTSVAGNAAISTVENKLDNVFSKVGVKPGAATFAFNNDGTFAMNAGKLSLPGTYTQNGNSVSLKFGKALTYLTMDGTVSSTTDGCKLLFNGEKFLTFTQKVVNYAKKITTSASVTSVANILATAKSVDAGFKLSK